MAGGIVVRDLTKRFGDRTAVAGLSFEVRPGEVFGFLGPNGAGKTTTVRMLTAMLRPTSGTAEVAGVPLAADGIELRRRIGVMPESAGLYLKLSVNDNLAFFAGLHGFAGAAADARIARALAAVGLEERRHDLAGTLSKGLRQRAALARTLIADPEVLFLDEPTAGLDPAASRDVRRLIEELRGSGVTVFLTTHRMEEAERLCDRVAILNTRLISVGSPDELRSRSFGNAIEVRVREPLADPAPLFTSVPGVQGWSEGVPGSYVVECADPDRALPGVARAVVGAGADLLHLGRVSPTLEQVYLQLVRES